MKESRVICPCGKKSSINDRYQTFWKCSECDEKFYCVDGIPKLYLEESLGKADRKLRDNIYQYLSWFYNFTNPFHMLPLRPFKTSIRHWIVFLLVLLSLGYIVYNTINLVAFRGIANTTVFDVLLLIPLVAYILLSIKDPRYGYLLLLAIPVKIILSIRTFEPKKSITSVHDEFLKEYLESDKKIQMLDIACGSGQALSRRGYLNLNADYTAVDLSEGMIAQARRLMSKLGAPVDFILTDATNLPFESETFDICTNYGALMGFNDPATALKEMARVTKKGGKILFLDEQEYESSTWLEHLYFKKVFAYHNTIVGCPVDLLPDDLEDIQVHQVYEFVFVCTARKKI